MNKRNDDFMEEGQSSLLPYMNILAAVLVITLVFMAAAIMKYGSLPGQDVWASDQLGVTGEQSGEDQGASEPDMNKVEAGSGQSSPQEIIRSYVGVKRRIINELVEKFDGTDLKLEIDKESGAVRFREADFFDSGEVRIKRSGESYLKKFFPEYVSVLYSEENRDYIDQIVIEGHTDDDGSYLYNLDLSQKRAYAVAMYIVSKNFPDFPDKQNVIKCLAANGRSYNDPILVDGAVSKQKSRRVEFRFLLKYDKMVDEMLEVLEGDK